MSGGQDEASDDIESSGGKLPVGLREIDMTEAWQGDPVFRTPSACRDARNTWRVFHRDIPGRIIAEFYGNNAIW